MCGACLKNKGKSNCDKHGTDYIDYKCIYCCQLALYNCGGQYYFCEHHHQDGRYRKENKERGKGNNCGGNNAKECDLGIDHPTPCEDKGNIFPDESKGKVKAFALGCSLCRETYENSNDDEKKKMDKAKKVKE